MSPTPPLSATHSGPNIHCACIHLRLYPLTLCSGSAYYVDLGRRVLDGAQLPCASSASARGKLHHFATSSERPTPEFELVSLTQWRSRSRLLRRTWHSFNFFSTQIPHGLTSCSSLPEPSSPLPLVFPSRSSVSFLVNSSTTSTMQRAATEMAREPTRTCPQSIRRSSCSYTLLLQVSPVSIFTLYAGT